MKMSISFLVLLFVTLQCKSQSSPRKWSISIFGQISDTRYDKTRSQNAVGMGAGIKIYRRLNNVTGLFAEGSSSAFGGTKEIRYVNGEPLVPKDGIQSLHIGVQYRIAKPLQMASGLGPSFSLGNTDWGFRQAVLLSLNRKDNIQFRLSFDHIFQDDYQINRDFGYIGYSLLIRVY